MYTVECSGAFKYLESWRVLKECPKFQGHLASVLSLAQSPIANEGDNLAAADNSNEMPRPMGSKASKKAGNRKRLFSLDSKGQDDYRLKTSTALAERNDILKRQNELNAEANAIQLYSLQDDDVSKEYLRLLKQKKLMELKSSI